MSKPADQSLTASDIVADDATNDIKDDALTFADKAKMFLCIYSLPYFYGAITTLPFVYFVIHLRFTFNLDWVDIGGYVACYQAAGVTTNFFTIFIPKTTHFVGTSLGLIGSIVVVVKSNDDKMAFILGTIAVGFSESFSSAQLLLKNLSCVNKDIELMSRKLKIQYASVLLGMTSAYFLGGTIYDAYGINGVATVLIIVSAFELLSLLLYVLLDKFFPDAPALDKKSPSANVDNGDDVNSHNLGTDDNVQKQGSTKEMDIDESEAQDPTTQAPPRGGRGSMFGRASVFMFKRGSVMDRIFQFGSNEIRPALDSFGTSDIGANFINYVFVITSGVQCVTIGFSYAITPIFMVEEFGISTTVVGIILAAGGTGGSIFSIFVTLSKRGQSFLKTYFPSPYNIFAALGGVAVCAYIVTIPVFPVYVAGLMCLMAFNDFGSVVLNDINGTITSSKAYGTIGPLGQVARRGFDVVTAITGPVLFGVYARLPYLVAGSITVLWLVILAVVIKRRMDKSDEKISGDNSMRGSVVEEFKRMSFAKKEVMKRQHKKGMLIGSTMKSTIPEGIEELEEIEEEESEEETKEEIESSDV
mmetsp:Transcript_14153/g.20084  ORF Transcript_14153/g.20084 Transcript_14153/m.20084 type:complete len:586 (+) Transcript_14153:229-1986(+)